jgi:hypothetical protein
MKKTAGTAVVPSFLNKKKTPCAADIQGLLQQSAV